LGEPAVRKEGKDLTLLTIGATLYRALEAAKQLEESHGLSCEVIDARSLVPFNYEPVIESIRKTRKILLASDACERGSCLEPIPKPVSWRDLAKSSWSRPEVEKARRRAEARREPL